MEEKYMNSIKAGAVGGIIMAVITVIAHFICCFGFVTWIVALATGVLAIYFGPTLITKIMDAVVVSSAAGGVAGLINGIVALLLALTSAGSSAANGSALGAGVGIVAGIFGLVISVVLGVILAAIAGTVYAFVALKVQS
ncbi:MAG TPA: hypothetical protein VK436_08685 [Methanocella sp.]|nr:hypothetical protein [Methanocella sp.]